MRLFFFSTVLILNGGVAFQVDAVAGQLESDTRTPSTDGEHVLRRFVAECVTITPGRGRFPEKMVLGSDHPSSQESGRLTVHMTKPFRVSRYETTQELFRRVTGRSPSRWKGPRNSVEHVTWTEATDFCSQLTILLRDRKLIKPSEVVRLPTWVEWEYCCRAGTTTRYSFGDSIGMNGTTAELDKYAWHTGNAAGNDPAVGVLRPNRWGLHDFHGYLWEFIDGGEPGGTLSTPQQCVIRGGAWTNEYPLLSSAAYLTVSKDLKNDEMGFRCVVAAEGSPKKTLVQ